MARIPVQSMSAAQRVAENDALAHWAVQRWARLAESHPDYEDAVQEARMAMLRAARAFDESLNYTFGTFACICLRNQLVYWASRTRRHGFGHAGKDPVRPPVELVVNPDSDVLAHDEWLTDTHQYSGELDRLEDAEMIRAALGWLYDRRPALAQAVWGRYFRRFPVDRIARLMGVSKCEASRLIRSGRLALEKYLKRALNS